jgi:hypothetical protein
MFKRIYPIFFIFVPSIIGYLHNIFTPLILSIPTYFSLYWYGSAILIAYFWFWVGGKFAQSSMKILASVLIGNLLGIVSLFVYLWQYLLIPETHRNHYLATSSQYFSDTISVFIGKLAYLFEPNKNVIGMVTYTAIQILGLLLMIIIFTIGFKFKKRV